MSEPSDVTPSVPPLPQGQTGPAHHEVTVDLTAFLPEGTELTGAEVAGTGTSDQLDPWDTGAPEPEVPAWARDDAPAPVAPTAPDAPCPAPAVAPDLAPSPPEAALDRIDEELAAVDDALLALDAGDPERSPLLRELRTRSV